MAGETPQTTPSPSSPGSPPASPAASPPASTSPAPTPSSTPAPAAAPAPPSAPAPVAAERPADLPETFWDGEKKQVNYGKLTEMAARDAAETSRRLTLPPAPDGYKFETTPDFKPPEGVAFTLDPQNPIVPQVKAWAHKHGLSQAALSEAANLFAANVIGDQQSTKAAFDKECSKLGAAATQRIDAVSQFLNAYGGPKAATLANMFKIAPIADTVEAMEHLMQKVSSQGITPFNTAHRAEPDANKIPGYDKMSFEQRRQAQDQRRAGATR